MVNAFTVSIILMVLTNYSMAIETPEYLLVDTVGEVEVRRYEPQIVAKTLVRDTFDSSGNSGFRRLAGYIFGNNARDQKISMTAPVTQQPNVPPHRSGPDLITIDGYWLTFTMPTDYSRDELPLPNDKRVELIDVQARYMAVLSYTGRWTEERYRRFEGQLKNAINANGQWRSIGDAEWARYNPPITPWFMRRNEVAIEVMPVSQPVASSSP